MCGRYALTSPPELIATLFGITLLGQMRARYNIAPGQSAPVVRRHDAASPRSLDALWWGLIPPWSKDAKIASQTINARAETAEVRPAFRKAFRSRRCLVPADGFFEWKRLTPKKKQPYFIHRKDAAPLAYAGLWERWRNPDDPDREEILTYTILTVDSNELLRPLHDRMPAILHPEDFDLWLDPTMEDPQKIKPLLRPYPAKLLDLYPVSTFVNRPANDGPRCVERVSEAAETDEPGLFSP